MMKNIKKCMLLLIIAGLISLIVCYFGKNVEKKEQLNNEKGIAVYINNVKVITGIPAKSSDYIFDKYVCSESNSTINWDSVNWSYSLNNAGGSVSCKLYFVEKPAPKAYANGTAVYFNPVTGAKCTAGEAVSTAGTKTGCMKWYTFNDDGISSDNINLILDHNTTAKIAWNSTGSNVNGPTNIMIQLATDTNSWTGVPTRTDNYILSNGTANYTINYNTYKARLIKASEIATITGNRSFDEVTATSLNWFYFDSNTQTPTAETTGASNYAWLYDYTNGCTSNGCNIEDDSTFGYWTSTAISGKIYNAWLVDKYGQIKWYHVEDAGGHGVRPVITILKSNL